MERPLVIVALAIWAAPALAGPGKDPRLFFYIGRAFENEGRATTALIYYRRYLREVEVPEAHRAEVRAKIQKLERSLPKPALSARGAIPPRPARLTAPGLTAPVSAVSMDLPDRRDDKPPVDGGRLVGEFLTRTSEKRERSAPRPFFVPTDDGFSAGLGGTF